VWLGTPNEKYVGLPEINAREIATLAPLAVIVVVLGVYPHAVLDLISTSLLNLNEIVKAGAAAGVAAR
jgi:NADH:ubiquinone oxidoreductase subunit 4 (subunit M)